MKNKYRLSSDAFEREAEEEKIQPQKILVKIIYPLLILQ